MQPGSHTVDLTNVRPRERNSQGVRGRYIPVVPSLIYIQRKEASSTKPDAPNAPITIITPSGPSSLSSASGSSGERRVLLTVLSSDRVDNGGNALNGQDEIADEDQRDLLEFAALGAWSNVKQSPICQISSATVQSLATTSMRDLFGQDNVKKDVVNGVQSRQETDKQANDNSAHPELAEFAALSHLPAIFGPMDPVRNHLSLPTSDNG